MFYSSSLVESTSGEFVDSFDTFMHYQYLSEKWCKLITMIFCGIRKVSFSIHCAMAYAAKPVSELISHTYTDKRMPRSRGKLRDVAFNPIVESAELLLLGSRH